MSYVKCMSMSLCRVSEIVATLTKSVKSCVLRLTPDKLYFVVVERGTVGGVNVWCELIQVGHLVWYDNPLLHFCEQNVAF